MATRSTAYVAYLLSLVCGVTQVVLAWQGGLLWNSEWLRPTDHVTVPWFGYIATFAWWVPYVTTVPVMIAFAIYGLNALWDLSGISKMSRWLLILALSLGFIVSTSLVAHEVVRSFTIMPDAWAQWNDLLAHPSASQWSPRLRTALHAIGYFHYLLAYALSLSCVFGALGIAMTYRMPRSLPSRLTAKRRLLDVLISVKVIVASYLFYLVLLRSSKVAMWLQYRHEPVALDRIYEFLKDAKPYFEVSGEGIFVDLMLGLLWCLLCFVVCVLLAPAVATANLAGVLPLSERIGMAYELLGKAWLGFFGLCLLGIMLPPPSGCIS